MALANRPKLLIADEPTPALDATIQAPIIRPLHRLTGELGMAALFLPPNMSLVADNCHQTLVK